MGENVNNWVVAVVMLSTLGMQAITLAEPAEACPAGQVGLILDAHAIEQSKTICIPGEALKGIMTAASNNESFGTVACPCWDHSFFLDTFETGGVGWSGGVLDGVFHPIATQSIEAVTGAQIDFIAQSSTYWGLDFEYAYCSIRGHEGATVTNLSLTWWPSLGRYDPITVEEADACVSDIVWSYCATFPERCHP